MIVIQHSILIQRKRQELTERLTKSNKGKQKQKKPHFKRAEATVAYRCGWLVTEHESKRVGQLTSTSKHGGRTADAIRQGALTFVTTCWAQVGSFVR